MLPSQRCQSVVLSANQWITLGKEAGDVRGPIGHVTAVDVSKMQLQTRDLTIWGCPSHASLYDPLKMIFVGQLLHATHRYNQLFKRNK